jgi:flagellar biogenesis protein FliO
MFDFLFGEGQYAIKLVFGLVVVIGLLAAFFWGLRRFGGDRLGNAAARGRQPRLAVIDAATVDGRRRLVLIRRDNVEHLLIIGGPTDVVVEQNIVRATPAQRDAPPARAPAATDTLPRAVPLGEGTMWPLQPEPAPRLEQPTRHEQPTRIEPAPRLESAPRLDPAPRLEPAPRPQRPPPPPPPPQVVEEEMQWSAEAEPPPPAPPPQRERRPRAADPLAGLAEELSRVPPAAPEPTSAEPAPRLPLRREPRAAPRPQPAPPPAPVPAPSPEAQFNSSADQNLAEMAQRLEAALRRPAAKPDDAPRAPQAAPKAAAQPAPEPMHDEIEGEPPPAPPPRAPAPPRGDARPVRADAKPAPQKSLYDSLEQEMASLLGRPNNKP